MKRIKVILGDITEQKVEAIVNAANTSLLGGGGVDGAIHRVAGPKLFAECSCLDGCETGMAKITRGYDLPSEYVIHTVGPIWQGGNNGEEELLANCYVNSFKLVTNYRIKSVAFPSISTGIYRFPLEMAVKIAIGEVKKFIDSEYDISEILFVCFDDNTFNIYKKELEAR